MSAKPKTKIGDKHYKLTAIKFSHSKNYVHHWKYQCDCGNTTIKNSSQVRLGKIKSCGCLISKQKNLKRNSNGHYIKYDPYEGLDPIDQVWKKNHYKRDNCSFEDFKKLSCLNCYYCGSPPSNKYQLKRDVDGVNIYYYNGIDRLISEYDHSISENLVPCCTLCNYAKRDTPYEDFKEWIKKAYHHLYTSE